MGVTPLDIVAREEAAEARGRDQTTVFQLSMAVNQLTRDVRLILMLLLPLVTTSLTISIVSLILVLTT